MKMEKAYSRAFCCVWILGQNMKSSLLTVIALG